MVQVNSTRARRRSKKDRAGDFVHEHKSGVHAGKFFVKAPNGRTPTGEQRYKRYGPFVLLTDAVAARDKHLAAQKLVGTALPLGREAKPMTTGEWVSHWLERIVREDWGNSTYTEYAAVINRYVLDPAGPHPLAHLPLASLNRSVIEDWKAGLKAAGVGPGAFNYVLMRLKTALQQAVDRDECPLEKNPTTGVKKRINENARVYEGALADYPKLQGALDGDYCELLPMIAMSLGLRQSEIAGLHWSDVDLVRRRVTLNWHLVEEGAGTGKRYSVFRPGSKKYGGKIQTVRIPVETVVLFERHAQTLREHRIGAAQWKAGAATETFYAASSQSTSGTAFIVPQHPTAPESLVFPTAAGAPFIGNLMRNWFRRACLKAGVRKTLHGMRHDCGSFLLSAGVPLPVVSKHLRHANTAVTARVYSHQIEEDADRASDAMDGLLARLQDQTAAVAV